MNDLIQQTEFEDTADCVKMFVCQLNAKHADKLDGLESSIRTVFGPDLAGNLDLSKNSLRFDLAAMVGRNAGLAQCRVLYGKCALPYEEMHLFMSHYGQYGVTNENNL